uniref:Chemokine interleukin-8-like domain-containing protein n=1 Tax=Neolamprologus brichardi TaxID=32507 RepID=A0A3Q4GA30_NEOBR
MLEKSLEVDAALSNPCFSVTAKAVNSPDLCCFHFFDKRIPKANIVSIVKTHRQCSTPAFGGSNVCRTAVFTGHLLGTAHTLW